MPRRKKSDKKSLSVYTDMKTVEIVDELSKRDGKSRGEVIAEAIAKMDPSDNDVRKPCIITVTSFKGGVAKTTTAANLALCLARYEHKVLLIDLDRQGSLSQYMQLYDPEAMSPCIADVMLSDPNGKRTNLSEVIIDTEYENLQLVTSSFRFANADSILKNESGVGIDMRLKHAIDDLNEEVHYDFIIIDCPPELSLVVTNAITALEAGSSKSFIIIPIRPDGFSEYAMRDTIRMIETVARERRQRTPRYYLLWTIIEPRTNVFRVARQHIEDRFSVPFLKTRIDKATKAAEASLAMEPLCSFAEDSIPARQYEQLATEVEEMVYEDVDFNSLEQVREEGTGEE